MQQAFDILNDTFGYSEFRHSQAEVIKTLLEGDDALVLMPTGGGKSLCYQLPAIIRPDTAIVISPLIALMHDQVIALKQLGIHTAFLNSSQNHSTQQDIEQALRQGEINLLYIAPERLLMDYTLNMLEQIDIALFAIDEAHCVSQWRHDFLKEYQQLYIFHQRFANVPRIALTATADKHTRQEIIDQLQLHNARQFINGFDRPNIHYTISEGQNGHDRLWHFIENEHTNDTGIVYCLSHKKVEATAIWLSDKGRIALPYHAGLSAKVRENHQQRFLREEGIIIVATIAFGMGIDKPDVQLRQQPKSASRKKTKSSKISISMRPEDGSLFEALRERRLQLVQKLSLPPYIIFHDNALKQMAIEKPSNVIDFSQVSGAGDQKLKKYGQNFVDIINQHNT